MLLVAGLRNPGSRYEGTRHNLGGDVVSVLADRHGASFKKARRFIRAEIAETRIGDVPVVLARPRTFMNESGQAVAPLVSYYKVELDGLLVVHDDIDLPFTKLKVQLGGGSGGNNGVDSVARSMARPAFWRLKCGVGRPPGPMDPADYVLRPFRSEERESAGVMVQLAADVVETFVASGGDSARQRAGELNTLG
ncbi:MAG: aminoacyl-tRNA hydrolase [Acidimicrobiia bacterium]